MNTGKRLMEALCACIRGRQVEWAQPMTQEDWQALTALAQEHNVLPMLVESVYRCDAFISQPEGWRRSLKQRSRNTAVSQTMRTAAALKLFTDMEKAGLHPVVMKGLTCRGLYPSPDSRISADEDLLVPEGEFKAAVDFLLKKDFVLRDEEKDSERAFELSFIREDGLHLELHKSPFPPESDALGPLNHFFKDAVERARPAAVGTDHVMGMAPHDHMLYLILHAYKHFIHSGFGVRQVCDIILWAEHYGTQIDWKLLQKQCESVRAWRFAQTVFQIGTHYLELREEQAGIPAEVLEGDVPYQEVLKDLLEGGVFGGKDLSRRHSSTITLRTVESNRKGGRYSLRQTLFPSRTQMMSRYPWLERWPVLLPAAWVWRFVKYGGELRRKDAGSNASESLRIGKQRTKLLKELDIID